MVGLNMIEKFVSGIKGAFRAPQAIYTARQDALSTQQALSKSQEENRALKAKLSEAEERERNRADHKLVAFPTGHHAYESSDAEPRHYLCTACFPGAKSILDEQKWADGRVSLKCQKCDRAVDKEAGQPFNPPRPTNGSWMA